MYHKLRSMGQRSRSRSQHDTT